MLLTKSTAAGLAAGLFIACPALAATTQALPQASETPAQIEAFSAMKPKVSLADAVASAESESSGKLLQIDFTGSKGRMAYDAVMLSGDKLVAENVDPLTGIASPPEAISSAPGTAIDAWLTTRNGKPAYTVGVVEADRLHTAYVDIGTGKIAWAQNTASTRAMAVNSMVAGTAGQSGDREVQALNLLEAQGYRDFASVRRSGADFDFRASKAGRSMMVQIDPDTGKIVNRV